MPFPRKRAALQFSEQQVRQLEAIRKSRTEEKRRTQRAAFLLDSASGQSDEAIARRYHVSRSTVVLCIQKFFQFGLDAALGELPRSGKPRKLSDDAIAWVQHCACQKPKELGYSYELWTYKLLAAHVRQRCVTARHPALRQLSRSKLHKMLRQRTTAAQDSILRGAEGCGLRNQNGQCTARLQGSRNRQCLPARGGRAPTGDGDDLV